MSTTRREVPVTSIYAKAVFTGNVSGDVTTITSVTFTQNEDDWLLGVKKEDMPSVMIIDGKQYRWTVNSYFTLNTIVAQGTWVKKATLNIGTKLTIRKPFFKIVYGQNPTQEGTEMTFSFYDLGSFTPYGFNPGASEFEIDGKTAVPINIENANEDSLFSVKLSSDATYRFKWAIGSKSYTLDKKTSGATKINTSYTIPKSWNEEIKNSTAGSCTLSVQVLFGSQVYQSRDTAVRATVPDDCVPVINSISIADTKGHVPTAWGMFVEHNSNIAITAANITKSYGADIVSVNMELNDRTYYGTPSALPQSYTLEDYGIMDVTVKIRDTRGRTAEKTAKVTVVEYNPPTIQVDSMRCGQDGTLENEGVYFLATTDSTYSTCNGKNKATLQIQYKLSSQDVYTSAVKELPIGDATTVCGGDLNTEFSYDVRYVLKDTFNTVTVIDFVSTAVYAMHFLHGGRGVAFGSKATVENAVDFTFDAIFRHGVKFIKSDGSEVTMQQILKKLGL